jgi:hypothetical protein
MGFNSAFKGLILSIPRNYTSYYEYLKPFYFHIKINVHPTTDHEGPERG